MLPIYLPALGKSCRTLHGTYPQTDQGPCWWPCRHRFWAHKSGTEDLVFAVWLDPCTEIDHILDVNFLRNLSGYLEDCLKNGLDPSVFQIILFTEHASSLLCPPFLNWMPVWMLFWVHRGLAWYAHRILG